MQENIKKNCDRKKCEHSELFRKTGEKLLKMWLPTKFQYRIL